MKYLEYLLWITGILTAIILLCAIVAFFTRFDVLGVVHVVNYFHVANTMLLICITCLLGLIWKKKTS
jgi:hypothetical protein